MKTGILHRALYLFVGLALGLAIAAHSASAAHPSVACKPSSAPVVAPKGHTASVVIDKQRWLLTYTRATTATSVHSDLGTSHAHGKYILVFLSATNLSKKPANLFLASFQLLDSQERSFTPNVDATGNAVSQYNLDGDLTSVQPTFTTHTVYAFDVAADAHGFTLELGDILGDNPRPIFKVGL